MRFAAFPDSESRSTEVNRGIVSVPAALTPLEEFPSSTAVSHHCDQSLHGVYTPLRDSSTPKSRISQQQQADAASPGTQTTEMAFAHKMKTRIDEAPTPCKQGVPTSSSSCAETQVQAGLYCEPVQNRFATHRPPKQPQRRHHNRASAADESTLAAPRVELK